MKDMRPDRDPRLLSQLLHGSAVGAGGESDGDAEQLARLRRRAAAVLIVVAALAVVVGPHLIDGTRISSVADQAAAQAGTSVLQTLRCPTSGRLSWATPLAPVALDGAVICRYGGADLDTLTVTRPVPSAQLAALNADLQVHTVAVDAASKAPSVGVRTGGGALWALVGVTSTGQLVALAGAGHPAHYLWLGAGPPRVWDPSPSVQHMLTADLRH